jgi:hypothetical protein
MKTVIDSFVSKEQLGFVPSRNIAEATHLTKLIQNYLDDKEENGLLLALDWEKSTDAAGSWRYYYHQALAALYLDLNLETCFYCSPIKHTPLHARLRSTAYDALRFRSTAASLKGARSHP